VVKNPEVSPEGYQHQNSLWLERFEEKMSAHEPGMKELRTVDMILKVDMYTYD